MKTEEPAIIKEITRLLKKQGEYQGELQRLAEIEPKWRADEKALVESGALDNEQTIRNVSNLRVKIDMLPGKRRQYADGIATLNKELAPLRVALADYVWGQADEALKVLRENLEKALRPLICDPVKEFPALVHDTMLRLQTGIDLRMIKDKCSADALEQALENWEFLVKVRDRI